MNKQFYKTRTPEANLREAIANNLLTIVETDSGVKSITGGISEALEREHPDFSDLEAQDSRTHIKETPQDRKVKLSLAWGVGYCALATAAMTALVVLGSYCNSRFNKNPIGQTTTSKEGIILPDYKGYQEIPFPLTNSPSQSRTQGGSR